MLTLKDFVKETLKQITDGANEFEEECAGTGPTIFPRLETVPEPDVFAKYGAVFAGWRGDEEGSAAYATFVEFDVAVSVEEAESAKAGGGIHVAAMFKAGGDLESQTANSSISRVRFHLPLQLG